MEVPTFQQTQQDVAQILKKQSEIFDLLLQKSEKQSEADNPQNIDFATELTGLSKPTIYLKCQNNSIPHYKKNGRLFFFKSELIDWIREGKVKTTKEAEAEVEAEVDTLLSNHKKRLQ